MRVLSEQVEILAPHDVVWAVLEDFGGVSDWAPYNWGFNFEEMVTKWVDGEGYSFEVYRAPYPMKDVHETWSAHHDNGLSTVTTQVTYSMRLGVLGRLLDWVLVQFVVKREMRAGLRGLKQHVEREAEKAGALQYAD